MSPASLDTLYDDAYAAVRACYAAGIAPWEIKPASERGRYWLVRNGNRDGTYTDAVAVSKAARRNQWEVRHARKLARQEECGA